MKKIIKYLSVLSVVAFCSCSSCERSREIQARRDALAQHDVNELEEAKQEFHEADSIASFMRFEIEDLKEGFAFEKNEEYQSKGFWVVKEHEGDKLKLDFFAEVEEEGQMLLVSIDKKRNWKFYKVSRGNDKFLSSKEVKQFIGRELTDKEKEQVMAVYRFSEAMLKLRDAEAASEKNKMKIEFYEKKMHAKNSGLD
ncbi:MAG: hypothetical protein K6E54_10160 [Bacteroidaceae bacterium]|nr:hypothetical protein [Bacteroidaceae bacterium]